MYPNRALFHGSAITVSAEGSKALRRYHYFISVTTMHGDTTLDVLVYTIYTVD